MRTTLTLDDAVAAMLKRVQARRGESLKKIVNQALREGLVRLAAPRPVAFVRLISNPRIFERPETVASAWNQVEEWLDRDPVWVPQPTERHREVLAAIVGRGVGRQELATEKGLWTS